VEQLDALDEIKRETSIPRGILVRDSVDLLIAQYARIKAEKPGRRGKYELATELTKAAG
jgi:hypothetical protein